ncbi:conserved hypothetical protein [Burkholderiales bacterium 8X]|nr:conserved hypothetical protein [Burkholderiales bacterium 8X]
MNTTPVTASPIADHPVVSETEWMDQRRSLLQKEKEFTRLGDQLSAERRAMPWRRIEKDYVFDTPSGRRSLAELFAGRRQLLVQHFMLGPGWPQGCPSCSYMADHIGGMRPHLAQRDVTVLVVSRAPLAEIERFRERMGWDFDWVSANGNDFNYDFHVSFTPEERATGQVHYNFGPSPARGEEAPGISAFYEGDGGEVFHTYSTFGRGVEAMMGTYDMLDLMPKGRDEREVPNKMEWVRHHDRYEPTGNAGSCCHPEP